MNIPDENIVAEIRVPDRDGNICLTLVLDRQGNVHCWPEFGDPVRIDPVELRAAAVATETLRMLYPKLGEEEKPGKTFEDIVHGR